LLKESPHSIIARIRAPLGEGVLYDALVSPSFCEAVLRAISRNRVFTTTRGGILQARAFSHFAELRGPEDVNLPVSISKAEQRNAWAVCGNRLSMKVYRRVGGGTNPDQEVGRYLTEAAKFPHPAPVVGAIEFRRKRKAEPMTLALLQGFVPNQG